MVQLVIDKQILQKQYDDDYSMSGLLRVPKRGGNRKIADAHGQCLSPRRLWQ